MSGTDVGYGATRQSVRSRTDVLYVYEPRRCVWYGDALYGTISPGAKAGTDAPNGTTRLVALAVGWSLTLSVSTYCLLSQSLLGIVLSLSYAVSSTDEVYGATRLLPIAYARSCGTVLVDSTPITPYLLRAICGNNVLYCATRLGPAAPEHCLLCWCCHHGSDPPFPSLLAFFLRRNPLPPLPRSPRCFSSSHTLPLPPFLSPRFFSSSHIISVYGAVVRQALGVRACGGRLRSRTDTHTHAHAHTVCVL